jgi:hypothetical protein
VPILFPQVDHLSGKLFRALPLSPYLRILSSSHLQALSAEALKQEKMQEIKNNYL